jgi:oxygen-independent coproporphyrinogen III oxidase
VTSIETGRPRGLYVHVPFCKRKCGYCDFYSLANASLVEPYLDALQHEMDFYADSAGTVDTIYLGGGTPSLLSAVQVENVIRAIRNHFSVEPEAEITFEANPESLNGRYLEQLRLLGINRLSLGIQSLDDNVLAFLGRGHNAEGGIRAFREARTAGFDNISMDFIFGVPVQGLDGWLNMLARALEWSPEHFSLYQLTIEPSTPLGRKEAKGLIEPLTEETQRDFFVETAETMKAAGYAHYEVSNFSLADGLESRHNSKYWRHLPYLGLGPAAHSFDGEKRWWNHRSVRRYVSDVESGLRPRSGLETLDEEALMLETLYFAFRTSRGVELDWFAGRYGLDLANRPTGLLNELVHEGWVNVAQGVLTPTMEGMLRADSLPLLWF